MPLTPGTRLGVYDITAKLGEGGMGEVWRARDTQLDRDVALKVLPEAFTADPERLARFEREAKVLASLNHPNIGHIYGLEEAEGTKALVLELVEGPTLADWIAHGPIPLDEALPIARQIAEALEAAHEQGIIHRDLKPANVKVKDDGTVKVLDFGLAKALDPTPEGDPSQSPTLTAAATQMGVIMGTAAYMSPEQARGKPVDKRADIWAFGCVLYEMLSGRRAFQGEDVSLTLASVMKSDLNVKTLPPDVPATIRTVLGRCLEKDPSERIRDIGDVRLAMGGAFETAGGLASQPDAPTLRVWQRPVPLVLAGLALAAITGFAVWSVTRPAPPRVARFPIPLAPGEAFTRTGRHVVALSPDGTQMAYVANGSLWLRPLDQFQAVSLAGIQDVFEPFFSPDGEWIAFFADGQLKKVSIGGGAPVTLCDAEAPWGASWGDDDMILFGQGTGGIWRVPGTGGTPEVVIELAEAEQAHGPQMLPGGEWVLFTLRPATGIADWDEAQLVVQSMATGERTVLVEGGRDARYVTTGHLLYSRDEVLFAVPFDVDARAVTGGPVSLLQELSGVPAGIGTGAAHFSLSASGTLAYPVGVGGFATGDRTLVWVDRQGREEPVDARPRPYAWVRISPGGTHLAMEVQDAGGDVWVYDLTRGSEYPLSLETEGDAWPLWTKNGDSIVWSTGSGLVRRAADGTGEVELLSDQILTPYSWSADGSTLLANNPSATADILTVAMDGDHAVEALLVTPFREYRPAVSPDGRWMAHSSNESGQSEIFVRPFPNVNDERYPISTGGGISPVWSSDGGELFYRNGDAMMVVSVSTDPVFSASTPEVVFRGRYAGGVQGGSGRMYDIAPSGDRFLMIKAGGQDAGGQLPPRINVVQHWFEELKARVPTP